MNMKSKWWLNEIKEGRKCAYAHRGALCEERVRIAVRIHVLSLWAGWGEPGGIRWGSARLDSIWNRHVAWATPNGFNLMLTNRGAHSSRELWSVALEKVTISDLYRTALPNHSCAGRPANCFITWHDLDISLYTIYSTIFKISDHEAHLVTFFYSFLLSAHAFPLFFLLLLRQCLAPEGEANSCRRVLPFPIPTSNTHAPHQSQKRLAHPSDYGPKLVFASRRAKRHRMILFTSRAHFIVKATSFDTLSASSKVFDLCVLPSGFWHGAASFVLRGDI